MHIGEKLMIQPNMDKSLFRYLAILCLFISFFISVPSMPAKASSNVIHVPSDYEKVQWAINNASAGDSILVTSGVYYEHITIDKPLTLRGESGTSIIDGNYTGAVVTITADHVNISGFTIRNSGSDFWESGIYIYNSFGNNISYNLLVNNGHGIWLDCSNSNILAYNNVSNNQCGIGLSNSNGSIIVGNNVFSSEECGIGLDYSCNNLIVGNTISSNDYGIWISCIGNNTIFHNNIINNTKQAEPFGLANTWDNGFEGNYWSDYNGTDVAPQDGIVDTSYIIDINNTDNYPLIGMFSDFKVIWEEKTYHVTTICNSTISAFQFNQDERILSFNVTGPDSTVGFCRITIPKALINETYTVLVDGEEVDVTVLPISNSSHAFLYFTYIHGTHEVVIIPEFPLTLILVLVMITTFIATITMKKKTSKTFQRRRPENNTKIVNMRNYNFSW